MENISILFQFQDQAIAHTDTVLMETATGHETRCLYSPFGDFFNKERDRLWSSVLDRQEIWEQLEELNVGRLRIAAKGIERKEEGLAEVGEDEQRASGMYMIGQVVALKDRVMTMAELHKEVAEGNAVHIRTALLPV